MFDNKYNTNRFNYKSITDNCAW